MIAPKTDPPRMLDARHLYAAESNFVSHEVSMLAYLFVILAVALRFVSHPFSFTPVGASLLYFGAKQPGRRAWIPLALLAASDVLLTRLVYSYPFTSDHYVTWAWYAGVLFLGARLKGHLRPLPIAGAALGTAVTFFLLSNLAVWAVWSMYPKSFSGLMMSYVAGLPFFRNELVSDLLFSAVMFGAPALVNAFHSRAQRAAV